MALPSGRWRAAGAGTSALARHYQLTDASLARYAAALVYYRLRQVDVGGGSTYSPVRTLAVPLAAGLLAQAAPNPSGAGTEVTLLVHTDHAGAATLRLTNQLGQQQLMLSAGTTTLTLPMASGLAPGLYLLRVQQGSQQQVTKLVRQ